MPSERQISGTVARAGVSPGSKSDHVGVVLRAESGEEYVLRRIGGNAFRDDALERLVGATITANGFVAGSTFMLKDWRVKKSG